MRCPAKSLKLLLVFAGLCLATLVIPLACLMGLALR
jgi:hypothetical protein